MTEYKCGSAKQCQFGEMCKPSYDIGGCNHFKQKKPLTNEEWIQKASTEQLAELLYDIRYDYQIPWKNKGVVEWLKQPHK